MSPTGGITDARHGLERVMLDRVTVRGFKSIRALDDFPLRALNVLIGANGAGKSNFITFFDLLARMSEQRLDYFVEEHAGPDALLFGSRKRTRRIETKLTSGKNTYECSLVPMGHRFMLEGETTAYAAPDSRAGPAKARPPDRVAAVADRLAPAGPPGLAIGHWRVYHFHDTSTASPIRQAQATRDNLRLKPDAGNLAPFLRLLRERYPAEYRRVVDAARLAAPFFGGFVYRDDPGERMELEWTGAADPDTVHGPRQLSDGTLRFICLATLLLQPSHLQPTTILIDEPEIGLHPYALGLLAALLRQASQSRQLIVSTQSADLVSELDPQDVVVVSRRDGESVFERLDPVRLRDWLEDHALGDLWKMNILGGRPAP